MFFTWAGYQKGVGHQELENEMHVICQLSPENVCTPVNWSKLVAVDTGRQHYLLSAAKRSDNFLLFN